MYYSGPFLAVVTKKKKKKKIKLNANLIAHDLNSDTLVQNFDL